MSLNSIKIGENWYTMKQAWDALRFVVERGYISAITPNPDHTEYHVPESAPVANVGQVFRYLGKPTNGHPPGAQITIDAVKNAEDALRRGALLEILDRLTWLENHHVDVLSRVETLEKVSG